MVTPLHLPTAGGPGCPENWASGFSAPGELRAIRSMASWGSKGQTSEIDPTAMLTVTPYYRLWSFDKSDRQCD